MPPKVGVFDGPGTLADLLATRALSPAEAAARSAAATAALFEGPGTLAGRGRGEERGGRGGRGGGAGKGRGRGCPLTSDLQYQLFIYKFSNI